MWWLLAEDPDHRPWWVAGSLSVLMIGYAVVKFYYFVRDRAKRFRQEQAEGAREEQAKARREASQEAWEVVDRLTEQVNAHTKKIETLEEKHQEVVEKMEERERKALERAAQCEKEHAHTIGRLSIIEAWARQRGIKIPPVEGVGNPPKSLPPTPSEE